MKVGKRGDNVVACCGDQCVVVDPASGKIVVKRSDPQHGAMSTHTIPLGDTALVVVEEPQMTVLVDVAKRRVGRPRSLVCN